MHGLFFLRFPVALITTVLQAKFTGITHMSKADDLCRVLDGRIVAIMRANSGDLGRIESLARQFVQIVKETGSG